MVQIVDHGGWQLTAADEGLHPPGQQQLWNESYYFDFAAADGSAGGYVRLGLYPNWNRAWYWACLVRPGEPTVLLADNAAPLPAAGTTAVRTPGYAAAQEIGEPLAAARLTLDAAAAVVLAGPPATAAAGTASFGLDLEWRTAGGVYPYKDLPRYEIPCQVSGTVTVNGQELQVAGWGERDHSWGERDWWQVSWLWTSGRLGDGTAFHGMQANIGFAIPWPAFAVTAGAGLRHLAGFSAHTDFRADGLPARSRLRLPGAPMTAIPLAFASVDLTAPDGREARLPRALCRFAADDGRAGYGWTEWNQPPGWRDHGWSYLADAGGGSSDRGNGDARAGGQ
jgi:hypothetical protein